MEKMDPFHIHAGGKSGTKGSFTDPDLPGEEEEAGIQPGDPYIQGFKHPLSAGEAAGIAFQTVVDSNNRDLLIRVAAIIRCCFSCVIFLRNIIEEIWEDEKNRLGIGTGVQPGMGNYRVWPGNIGNPDRENGYFMNVRRSEFITAYRLRRDTIFREKREYVIALSDLFFD